MTTLDHTTPTAHFATRTNIVARLMQVAFNFYQAFRNRREFYRLGELSDTELADIGLTRADLHGGHLLGVDPTARLGALVRERAEDHEAAARRIC